MGSIIFVLKGILSDDVAEGVVLACDNVVAREGVWLLSTVYMKRTNGEKKNQRSDSAFSPEGLRECRTEPFVIDLTSVPGYFHPLQSKEIWARDYEYTSTNWALLGYLFLFLIVSFPFYRNLGNPWPTARNLDLAHEKLG